MILTTTPTQFLLNDKPFRIFSGAKHYFRVVPEYWRDRMEKMRVFELHGTQHTIVEFRDTPKLG
jgi:beta-galactosidase